MSFHDFFFLRFQRSHQTPSVYPELHLILIILSTFIIQSPNPRNREADIFCKVCGCTAGMRENFATHFRRAAATFRQIQDLVSVQHRTSQSACLSICFLYGIIHIVTTFTHACAIFLILVSLPTLCVCSLLLGENKENH